jgi:hypothetical protein
VQLPPAQLKVAIAPKSASRVQPPPAQSAVHVAPMHSTMHPAAQE